MVTIFDLIKKIATYNLAAIPAVMKAYEFAERKHRGQTRESGEPYITHPIRVAILGTERFADKATLCAEILHDVCEDCGVTFKELVDLFGLEVATLVQCVTNIKRGENQTKQEFIYANERRLIEVVMQDVRALMIKFDDRLDNMRTLQYKNSEESRIRKAKDTLNFYVPLAYEFGEQRMANELEDLCFQHINPEKYNEYSDIRKSVELDRISCIEEMLRKIKTMLSRKHIPAELKYRVLNTYGIYKKVILGEKKLNGIDDLFALKIILREIDDCYDALRVAHEAYPILQGNMKDYIYAPKRNEYRAIHTALIPPDGKGSVKVFIRTKQMEGIAEHGLSYYWNMYRGKARGRMQDNFTRRYELCKTVFEINPEKGNAEYIERLVQEISSNKINVYTMAGDLFEIQEGATVVDFAYKIHTEIGDNMIGVLVNGSPVPFNYVLRWNDRVEIVTGVEEISREGWEQFVITPTAREKIKTRLQRRGCVVS